MKVKFLCTFIVVDSICRFAFFWWSYNSQMNENPKTKHKSQLGLPFQCHLYLFPPKKDLRENTVLSFCWKTRWVHCHLFLTEKKTELILKKYLSFNLIIGRDLMEQTSSSISAIQVWIAGDPFLYAILNDVQKWISIQRCIC